QGNAARRASPSYASRRHQKKITLAAKNGASRHMHLRAVPEAGIEEFVAV
ncbi:hypothetical protein A2U01_0075092, partial [Trifolium medium]|nr:hypothetical protein [Trifolium medium]